MPIIAYEKPLTTYPTSTPTVIKESAFPSTIITMQEITIKRLLPGLTVTLDTPIVHSGGGASTWDEIENKPFSAIGAGLKVESDVLKVNTATQVIQDNTLPITSGAVYAEVGNINALLSTI